MTKDEILSNITEARKLLDAVYYYAEAYNEENRTNASPQMLEIERLMSWCDSCAMDAEAEIKSHFQGV